MDVNGASGKSDVCRALLRPSGDRSAKRRNQECTRIILWACGVSGSFAETSMVPTVFTKGLASPDPSLSSGDIRSKTRISEAPTGCANHKPPFVCIRGSIPPWVGIYTESVQFQKRPTTRKPIRAHSRPFAVPVVRTDPQRSRRLCFGRWGWAASEPRRRLRSSSYSE